VIVKRTSFALAGVCVAFALPGTGLATPKAPAEQATQRASVVKAVPGGSSVDLLGGSIDLLGGSVDLLGGSADPLGSSIDLLA
jgi:hypothetical protein